METIRFADGAFAVADLSPPSSVARDFDGSGRSDILWGGRDGEVTVWSMDGARTAGDGQIGSLGDCWHLIA